MFSAYLCVAIVVGFVRFLLLHSFNCFVCFDENRSDSRSLIHIQPSGLCQTKIKDREESKQFHSNIVLFVFQQKKTTISHWIQSRESYTVDCKVIKIWFSAFSFCKFFFIHSYAIWCKKTEQWTLEDFIIDLCLPPFYLQSKQKHHWKAHKNRTFNGHSRFEMEMKWNKKKVNRILQFADDGASCLISIVGICCLHGVVNRYSYTIN